jgi:hypothetical protein
MEEVDINFIVEKWFLDNWWSDDENASEKAMELMEHLSKHGCKIVVK